MSLATGRIPHRQWAELLQEGRQAWRTLTAFLREHHAGRDEDRPEFDVTAAAQTIPVDDLRKVDGEVAGAVVLPAVLSLLRLAIDASNEAEEEGKRLAAACRSMEAEAPDAAFWQDLAAVIEAAFVRKANYQALRQMVGDERQHVTIRIIGRLCAGHVGSPEEALAEHLALMPHLLRAHGPRTAVHHRLLLPYVQQYWTHRAESQGWLFSNPDLVRNHLASACTLPEEQRIQAILRAVLLGVRIRDIPPEIKEWLVAKIGMPSVPQPPNAEDGEAEATSAQPQAEGQPQSVQQVPALQPGPASKPPGAHGNEGLRTWHLTGFLPVEARTKSEARALFKKQRPIPPGAKIE
jgi:hypothetical protein